MPLRSPRKLSLLILLALSATACRKSPVEPDPIVPDLPSADPQTVLFSENFDNENGAQGKSNWTQFSKWNVVAGCVDLHGNGFVDVQRNNGLYVDLDGTCDRPGVIETKTELSLDAGGHVLEFWLAGNQRNARSDTVVVTLGSVFEEQFILERGAQFREVSRTLSISAPVQARLRFAQQGGGDQEGILLDQVRIRRAN